jgi:hypothetical protein
VRIVEGISLHLMNTETRIAAAACVPGVGRRCYRFTRPGQMKTPVPIGNLRSKILVVQSA